MYPLLSVMAGGAIGAGGRYVLGSAINTRLGMGFPYGTLAINLFGGLLMGVLMGVIAKGGAAEAARLFFGVGILGGFTTFSAFSMESWGLIERGAYGAACLYIGVSVFGALALVVAGVALGKSLA